ncbi:hypothetical protein [Streptomyces sp. NPDC004528]|uniref:hypothetical protein n=1 Tax=Streptomyces sp. NPDC004528 TaxID=3154550 RepID=UPI0033AC3254
MYPFLARAIFETWAAKYSRESDPSLMQAYHTLITLERPHTVAPMVPETFRGPKWGQR